MSTNPLMPVCNNTSRRKFVSDLSKATSAIVLAPSLLSFSGIRITSKEWWTVGEIMDLFIKEVPGSPFEKTVDTLKSGDRNTKVTGIVTTMFPTLEVIQKAIKLGANFIIVHEPSFYNHLDETEWLKNDEVYRHKSELLKKHEIAIWRNHDYIHSHVPDGVLEGVLMQLGWKQYQDKEGTNIVSMPAVSLQTLIRHIKSALDITTLRYIGDLSQSCKRILLLPGAYGGRRQIEEIGATVPDVLVCGEIQEWETAEYIRDARAMGKKISLVIMGHIPSEEPGSVYMVKWLKEKLPGMKVTHLSSKNPFMFL